MSQLKGLLTITLEMEKTSIPCLMSRRHCGPPWALDALFQGHRDGTSLPVSPFTVSECEIRS